MIIEKLSEDMKLVLELCGIDTVLALIDNCAGVQIYVSAKKLSFFEDRIGAFATDFVEKCSGLVLTIAKNQKANLFSDEIVARFDGSNTNELAVEFGCCRKQIYTICKRAKNVPALPSLFD